ncbi:hypothetical protein TNCV_1199331 [Trichonephila clavipes]|uniref:Uncharacterized protein n=1 Tax=Trichonephila clavipes TaxID=2585209 RepID=A0A8X6S3V4_TRICX|nr:hypothetical protein TNCV_1199331 [Trichonephila clavipes]
MDGVRSRIVELRDFVKKHSPDILLQETGHGPELSFALPPFTETTGASPSGGTSLTVFSDEKGLFHGDDEEESNDEEFHSKYDSSNELDRDLKEGDTVENKCFICRNAKTFGLLRFVLLNLGQVTTPELASGSPHHVKVKTFSYPASTLCKVVTNRRLLVCDHNFSASINYFRK